MKKFFLLIHLFCFFYISYASAQKEKVLETIEIIKDKSKHPHYVLVSAHRGYWANYPENTIDAYQMAINLEADIIEMDVRTTKDNHLVVFHDACLDRMTSSYGVLKEESWDYIKNLYLKNKNGTISSYKILLLSQALDYLKDKAVIAIDIKETGTSFNNIMLQILQLLKDKNMLYQSIIKGKIRLNDLNLILNKIGITLNDFIYTPIAFSTTPNLQDYISEYVNTHQIYAIELVYKQSKDPILQYIDQLSNAHIWIGQYSFWPETGDGVIAEKAPLTDTDPIIRSYNFQDKDPNNYLDDGRGDWDWLFAHGADYIITDRSEILIEYLNKQGRRIK